MNRLRAMLISMNKGRSGMTIVDKDDQNQIDSDH